MIRIASAHRLINLLRFKHRSGAEKCQLRAQNQTLDPSCRTPKNRSFVWRICQVPCVRIGGKFGNAGYGGALGYDELRSLTYFPGLP